MRTDCTNFFKILYYLKLYKQHSLIVRLIDIDLLKMSKKLIRIIKRRQNDIMIYLDLTLGVESFWPKILQTFHHVNLISRFHNEKLKNSQIDEVNTFCFSTMRLCCARLLVIMTCAGSILFLPYLNMITL